MSQPDPGRFDPSRRDFLYGAAASLLAAATARGVPLAPPDKQPPNLPIPGPPQKKLGFAIVGLGELALGQILPAFALCDLCAPVALVSGHADKAHKVADHYAIDPKNIYSYDNYDSIKDNPTVDVIYIVLPNSMHAEYTVRGFAAGKHVLCEKPMCATLDEANQMIDAGKKAARKLMIAYRLHYEPYNQQMIEVAGKKLLGPIKIFESQNNQNVDAPNIRLSKALAGGPVGDVGVYCINAARYITGEEPTEVTAMQTKPADDPRFAEVPATVTFALQFPSGALGHCSCGFDGAESRRYRFTCKDGWAELENAFGYEGQQIRIMRRGQVVNGHLSHKNHFAAEMDHFAQCIRDNKQPNTPGEEGLADMKVQLAVQQAAVSGERVKVGSVNAPVY